MQKTKRSATVASNLLLRTLTALAGIPVLVGSLWLGGVAFVLLVLLLSVVGMLECYQLLARVGLPAYRSGGLMLGLLLTLLPIWPPALPLAVLWGVGLLIRAPFRKPAAEMPVRLAATLLGAVYPAALLGALLALRLHPGPEAHQAFGLTLGVLIMIWAADTFGYGVGKLWGRRLLAPRISPGKTWEGALGGLVGALLVAVVWQRWVVDFLAWPHMLVLGFLCGTVGPLGDLAESQLKRAAGVKDSGTLLPGHGGVLDRFDALLVVAPLAYCYLRWVVGLYA